MKPLKYLNFLIPYYKMGHQKFKRKITTTQGETDSSNELCKKINEELENLYPTFLTLANFEKIEVFCPAKSAGCGHMCLAHKNKNSSAYKRAKRLANLFIKKQNCFLTMLRKNLEKMISHCQNKKLKLVVRLNNTSDIRWEEIDSKIFSDFEDIQFYDYTKHNIFKRLKKLNKNHISNYHLIYSRKEKDSCRKLTCILERKIDVAVVCTKEVKTFLLNNKEHIGYKVIDGDIYDARVIDRKIYNSIDGETYDKGFIILLESIHKNNRKDDSGFVITCENLNNYM